MEEKIARLMQRFPDHRDIIRSLSTSSAPFQDLINEHHDTHRRLTRSDMEYDRARREDAERHLRHLEEEMIRLIQGYPLA